MKAENSKSKTLVITAWVFLLMASDLPRIVLQEIFHYQVSNVLGISGLTIPNEATASSGRSRPNTACSGFASLRSANR